jgi:CheY-like chemotaxis protein
MEQKTKILAIDDNSDNLATLVAVLEDLLPAATVVTSQRGPQGIELARQEQPDTILLDVVMPEMDGFEVCRILKNDN